MILSFDSIASGMRVMVYRFMCIVLLVSPLEAESDTLTLRKEGPKAAYEGDLIEYALVILNTGGSAIVGIEVLDALPVEVDYVDATSTLDGMYNPVTKAWKLPALGSGEQDNTAGLKIQALVKNKKLLRC